MGVTTPAGIINKVTGSVVHRPGVMLVDGSCQPADQVRW